MVKPCLFDRGWMIKPFFSPLLKWFEDKILWLSYGSTGIGPNQWEQPTGRCMHLISIRLFLTLSSHTSRRPTELPFACTAFWTNLQIDLPFQPLHKTISYCCRVNPTHHTDQYCCRLSQLMPNGAWKPSEKASCLLPSPWLSFVNRQTLVHTMNQHLFLQTFENIKDFQRHPKFTQHDQRVIKP